MLDRLMITCSVVELLVLGCSEGPGQLTTFQWAMLILLLMKFATIIFLILRRLRVDNCPTNLPFHGSAYGTEDIEE